MYAFVHQGTAYGPDGIIKDTEGSALEARDTGAYNKELERQEIERLKTHPDQVFLYYRESKENEPDQMLTTWLGTAVGEVISMGPRRVMGFQGHYRGGSYRRAITARIYGRMYHGWYMGGCTTVGTWNPAGIIAGSASPSRGSNTAACEGCLVGGSMLRTMNIVDEGRKSLDAYAWPGGYPIMYLAKDGFRNDAGKLEPNPYDRTEAVCCATCAKDIERWPDIIVTGHYIHHEGPPEQCEFCSEFTESAYGDPDEEGTEE